MNLSCQNSGSDSYWNYYLKHLIPGTEKIGKVYILILDKIKGWDKIKSVSHDEIRWTVLNLKDEWR